MKIRAKMVLGFSTITLILLVVVAIYSFINIKSQMTEKINTESISILKENSDVLTDWFLTKAKNIEITSMLITDTSKGDYNTNYLQHYKNDPDITDMYIGLPDKKIIDASGWVPPADYDLTAREWYKNAIEKKTLVFSDPYIDADTKEMVITPSTQITNAKGEVTGVLAADIFLTNLVKKVSAMKVMDGKGYAFLIDSKGMMISDPMKELDGLNLLTPADAEKSVAIKALASQNMKLEDLQGLIKTMLSKDMGTTTLNYGTANNIVSFKKLSYNNWVLGISIPNDSYYSELKSFQIKYIVICIVALLLVVLSIELFSRFNIVKPIIVLVGYVKIMANGDFSQAIDQTYLKRKDEMGDLANSLHEMKSSIKEVIQGVVIESKNATDNAIITGEHISKLNQQIEEVSSTTEEISAGMEETAASTQEMNAMSTEIEIAIGSIASKAQEGAISAVEVKKRASELKRGAEFSENNAQIVYGNTLIKLKSAIEESKAVEQINVLSESILAITSQTNLLALNAAIEAARAGEAGRGFAVVADEIRKLAENSTNTVSEIQHIAKIVVSSVEKLSESSEQVIEFIDKQVIRDYKEMMITGEHYSKDADYINDLITDFSATSEEVLASIQNMVKAINEVAIATNEGASGTTIVTQKMTNVEENAKKVLMIAEVSKESSQKLIELVTKFKI
jgi:methyl-accepting chemotaxis protein